MKINCRHLLTALYFCMPFIAFNQLDSVLLTSIKDTYVDPRLPSENFESLDTMKSGTNVVTGKFGSNIYYQRVFLEFNLSSIPSNAIISSADIQLTRYNGITANFDWKTKMVLDEWDEDITLNTQPSISNITGDVSTVAATTDAVQVIDVTDMVQRMVYGAADNNGWSVQVDDENYSGYSGTWFYTKEYSSNDDRPKLNIKYYLPLSLTNVNVVHESSSGAEDAMITYSLENGCSSSYTYKWIDTTGATICTNDSLIDVEDGWYGLQVSGSDCSDTLYMGFLVGTQCEEVTITYTPLSDFMDNTLLQSNAVNSNFNNYEAFRSGSWTSSSLWYYAKTLMLERTWMDDEFTINQADITYQNHPSWTHYNNTNSTDNSASLTIVDEYWNPSVVTYNSAPSTGLTALAVSETPVGYSSVSKTLDMTTLWEEWKSDNTVNYGVLFEQDQYSSNYNRQRYASPDYSNSDYHPVWTFKLELSHPDNPILCGGADEQPYNALRREIDGGYGESFNDTLNIVFDENYGVDTNLYLITTIYDDDHDIIASCDIAGATTGGMPSLPWVFDDNRYEIDLSGITSLVDGEFYLLEAKNAKGERFYLKFKHNE